MRTAAPPCPRSLQRPNQHRTNALARCLLAALLAAGLTQARQAEAAWPTDPAINLPVGDGPGEQVLPLIGATSDGGAWIAWFDNSAGSYQVRLQRLDAAGTEQWPHQGLLISDHPQNSALFGWDMTVDAADHAVIVFSDERDGGDLDIHAYRIAPDGTFVWGPDGAALSANADFEPAPRVAAASDGDLVFAWMRAPGGADSELLMARLAPDGTPRLPPGGLSVVAVPGESPGFVDLVPGDDGGVILAWLRDTRSFASPRHLHARKFDASGSPVWPATVVVQDDYSLPIGYFPTLLPDAAGGAILGWHRSDGALFSSFVQRLDRDGAESLPHLGVAISIEPGFHHIDPSFSYDAAGDMVFAAWNERNGAQSMWGTRAQAVDPAGARLFGDSGVELQPVDATYKLYPRIAALGASAPEGGALIALVDQPGGSDRLIAWRVDAAGTLLWGGAPLLVSSAAGSKARYPIALSRLGGLLIAWEDSRGGTPDVYAQALTADGQLGAPLEPAGPGGVRDLRVAKAGGDGGLELRWSSSCPVPAPDHGILEGAIGDFFGHVAVDCSDELSDLREIVLPFDGSRYFLVLAHDADAEGSLGLDSFGAERPQSLDPLDRCVVVERLADCP